MLRIRSLQTPSVLPATDATRSFKDNKYSYDPEVWEFQYEIYRYLARIPNEQLLERYRAIVHNMRCLISNDRHVIPIQSFLSSWYWYRKEHQTRLEITLRSLGSSVEPPQNILDRQLRNAPVRPAHPNACDVIFRYDKREHMEALRERGAVRITPASFYSAQELGSVRGDEERSKKAFLPGQYSRITTIDGREMPILGDIVRSVSAPDYYVLCMSCDWDPILFAAFESDACIAIFQPEVFSQRLQLSAKSHVDGWLFHDGPVEYFDPFERIPNHIFNASICKDFRFAYQREYRFIWMPMNGENTSGVKELEIGSLTDVCNLYFSDGYGV